MKLTKRIVSLITATVFILTLCACGEYVRYKSSASADSSITSSISSESSVTSSVEDVYNKDPYEGITEDMKGTTIRFVTWEDYFSKINYIGQDAIDNIYNDIGLEMEFVHTLEYDYFNKIKTMVASGDAPDVFKSGSTNSFPLTLDFAAPINRVSTVDLTEPIWDQSLINTATIDGDVYLVNTIRSPWNKASVLYYDKSIFEENGIKTPSQYYEEGAWTWENFEKCIRSLKAADPTLNGAQLNLDPFLNSQGHALLQYSNISHFSGGVTTGFFRTYNEYQRLKDDGIVALDSTGGRSAMWVGSISPMDFAPIKPSTEYDGIGFTYLPSVNEGEHSRIVSEHVMYGIVDGSKNADAAGYFLRYWLDPDNYDLTDHFYSAEMSNFYYEVTTVSADQKFFSFDNAGVKLTGKNPWSEYNNPSGNTAPANALVTAVNTVKDQANKKINDRIYKTLTEYGNSDVNID